MIAFGKIFLLVLAASSVSARASSSSPDVNGPGSSPSAVATNPLEGLVKVLNRVPLEGGDVDVEDKLRTTASSNNPEDLDVILEGPVKILNYVAADVGGDELEADNVDKLHANAGGRNFKDVDVVTQVKFGGLRTTASNSCLGPGSGGNPLRPRPVRNGERYRFNIKVDAECRDADNLSYEWGEFQNVMDTTECAEKCVTLPDASLVNGGTFRGFEFACSARQCRCMYDAGTLSTRTSRGFNRSRTNQAGEGSITKFAPRTDRYCGKLVGATTLEIAVQ